MLSSTTDLMTVLLACIAGISLLVGGIGIMNIMYVSVTERTREIGLRMSIGAKGRHILWQFLIEAVIISVTGGVIGVVLGITASAVIKYWIGWPVYVQLYSVVLSFAVCTVTGIFFGWYPARKASNLDPIEAIRYEESACKPCRPPSPRNNRAHPASVFRYAPSLVPRFSRRTATRNLGPRPLRRINPDSGRTAKPAYSPQKNI